MASEVESARADQGITYSETIHRGSKGAEQMRQDSEYKVHESKKTVDAATQSTGVKEVEVQENCKDPEEHTEKKLFAFIVRCIMMLHSESNKTEAQLEPVIHSLYKEFYQREQSEQITNYVVVFHSNCLMTHRVCPASKCGFSPHFEIRMGTVQIVVQEYQVLNLIIYLIILLQDLN